MAGRDRARVFPLVALLVHSFVNRKLSIYLPQTLKRRCRIYPTRIKVIHRPRSYRSQKLLPRLKRFSKPAAAPVELLDFSGELKPIESLYLRVGCWGRSGGLRAGGASEDQTDNLSAMVALYLQGRGWSSRCAAGPRTSRETSYYERSGWNRRRNSKTVVNSWTFDL